MFASLAITRRLTCSVATSRALPSRPTWISRITSPRPPALNTSSGYAGRDSFLPVTLLVSVGSYVSKLAASRVTWPVPSGLFFAPRRMLAGARALTARPSRRTGSKRQVCTARSTNRTIPSSTWSGLSRRNASTWPSVPISISPVSTMLASACSRTSRLVCASASGTTTMPTPLKANARARIGEQRIALSPCGYLTA
ncbi:hypothetical protein D3C71_1301500 [compost metagenome]